MDLEVQALRNLRRMEVQLLMLDEVHNILAGSPREQRIVLNTLRYVSDERKISLACFGISEAREAIGGDVQLARRFEEIALRRWQGDEEFQELVVAIKSVRLVTARTILLAAMARFSDDPQTRSA